MLFSNQLTSRQIGKWSALVTFACMLFSGTAQATTYNAVNDFSLTGNPNGVWSYLSGGISMPTPVVGSSSIFSGAGFDFWYDSNPFPDSALIGKNVTGSTLSFETIILPTNYLEMDPEAVSNVDVRFIAPSTGNYSITGGFLGIDTGENSHPVEIMDNGTVVFSDTIASYGQNDPFNLTESLHAGDVLNFENLTGSTLYNLSTGLAVTITPSVGTVPEPGSLWIAGVGLVAFFIRTACVTSGIMPTRRQVRVNGSSPSF